MGRLEASLREATSFHNILNPQDKMIIQMSFLDVYLYDTALAHLQN